MLKKWRNKQDELASLHIDKARKGGIIAIYRLFMRYYFKSFVGPFFNFVFPVLIFAILGELMNPAYMLPGIIAMVAAAQGIMNMPFAIIELKKSVLLKRIGASPVKPIKFTIVIVTWYTFMVLASVMWLMLWALILHPSEIDTLYSGLGKHHGASLIGFIYGNLLNIIVCLMIGFAIASFAKSENHAQAIGMLFYFPSTFLAGQFIAIDTIAQNEVMNWISRFMPLRYTTAIVVSSWSGENVFNFEPISGYKFTETKELLSMVTQGKTITAASISQQINIYDKVDLILAQTVPYAVIVGSGFVSIKKFSWSASR